MPDAELGTNLAECPRCNKCSTVAPEEFVAGVATCAHCDTLFPVPRHLAGVERRLAGITQTLASHLGRIEKLELSEALAAGVRLDTVADLKRRVEAQTARIEAQALRLRSANRRLIAAEGLLAGICAEQPFAPTRAGIREKIESYFNRHRKDPIT